MKRKIIRFTSQKPKRRFTASLLKTIGVIGGLALGALGVNWIQGYVSETNFFKVDSVLIEGNQHLTKKEIIEKSGIKIGESIFKIDSEKIEQRLESIPRIKRVIVSKILPSKVKLMITEEEPIALILENKVLEVTESGKILEDVKLKEYLDLPVITGFKFKGQGKSNQILVDKEIYEFLGEMKRDEPGLFAVLSEISLLDPENLVFYSRYGKKIDFGKGDYNIKLLKLKYSLTEIANNDLNVQYIDLRYKNQAILKGGEII